MATAKSRALAYLTHHYDCDCVQAENDIGNALEVAYDIVGNDYEFLIYATVKIIDHALEVVNDCSRDLDTDELRYIFY